MKARCGDQIPDQTWSELLNLAKPFIYFLDIQGVKRHMDEFR